VNALPVPLRIAREARVAFASDLHLSASDPGTADMALAALHKQARGCAHLFLLGDLFEMWVGDDGADALALRLASLLSAMAADGTSVWLMRGNRDFLLDVQASQLHAATFSSRCAATLLDDPCLIDLHGVRTLLAHGDAYCTDDTVYQQWRATCRQPAWQQAMLSRSLAEREALGRQAREHSEAGKREQSDALMDVNLMAVEAAMEAAHAALLIHGHTHRPALHRWQDAGGTERTRLVLPDWDAGAARGHVTLWQDGALLPPG
jgi:UDP-2,3-diacylglucosamine hydrolase